MKDFRGLIYISSLLLMLTVTSFAKLADYRFTACEGSNVANMVSGDLNGTLLGDAHLVSGESAVAFSGDGKMVVEHDDRLDLTEHLSVSFWVNPASWARQALIVRGDGEGNESERLYGSNAEYSLVLWEDGRFKYKHNQQADTFSTAVIPKNEWTHIALVRDNGHQTIAIYINGELDTTNGYTLSPRSSHTEKLLIGTGEYYSSTMNNFKGKMDEIKIYNIGLTPEEVANIYNAEKDGVHLETACVVVNNEENNGTLEENNNDTVEGNGTQESGDIEDQDLNNDNTEENTTQNVEDVDQQAADTTTAIYPVYIATIVPDLASSESSFEIGNKVWLDEDADGLQSSQDQGVAGIGVILYDQANNVVGETQTDEHGQYTFNDIPEGTYHLVFGSLPSGYAFTLANVGGDYTLDSDVDETTGETAAFLLDANNFSWDAGIVWVGEDNGSTDGDSEISEVDVPTVTEVTPSNVVDSAVLGESEACQCETYDSSSVPSMGAWAMLLVMLFTSMVGGRLLRNELV